MRRPCGFAIALVAVAGILDIARAGSPEDDLAGHILRKATLRRGIVAVLGTRGAEEVLGIAREEGIVLLVQEPDPAAAERARRALEGSGALGIRAVVEGAPLDRLLLADDTADLIVAVSRDDGRPGKDLSPAEILRALRPGGRAVIGRPPLAGWRETLDPLVAAARAAGAGPRVTLDRFGAWIEWAKPQPDGIDAWSHWEHGPDNNPVSTDRVIRAPYRTQWLGGPYYIAMPAITTAAGGRIFTAMGHIAHHEREEPWLNTLLARNAYNGVELWRRKLPDGYLVHRSAFVATEELLYLIEGEGCLVLDPETGREVDRIRIPGLDGEWKHIAIVQGILYALAGGERDASETTVVRSPRTHWSWGELSDGYYRRRIPWGYGTTVAAYDLARKRLLWRHAEDASIDGRSLVIGGGRVFFYAHEASVACLDAARGDPLWKNADPRTIALIEEVGRGLGSTPGFKTSAIALYTPEALVIQAQTHMNVVALSPDDGRLLWTRKKVTSNPNAIYADGRILIGIGPEGSTLALDPRTGETIEDLGFKKRSCARLTAAPDSFFCRGWPEGLTRYDRSAKRILFDGAVRPACNDGVIPAHGLLTIGPWLCDCNLQLMGTLVLAPAAAWRPDAEDPIEARIERAADPSPAPFPEIAAEDWPTYRASNDRTAASRVFVPREPKPLWTWRPQVPFLPSAPVAAAGLVLVGGDDGRVRAIEEHSGAEAWRAQTGGIIPFPPTVWRGRVFAGSGDGFVYALEAATGRLLWRFRVAPLERRILVHDRISSTWPVAGGVLVADGIAYAAAGIADFDGTHIVALGAATGEVRWRNTSSGHIDPELRKGVSAQGILTIAGGRLWMPGGNVISPACYRLDDGACLTRAVGDGSPRANRGEEIGVLKDGIIVFGGRLRFSATRNVVNPGSFVVAAIGPEGLAASAPMGSGKVPPAWNDRLLVAANGPFSTPAAFRIEAIEKHLAAAREGGDPSAIRRLVARGPEPTWVARELQGSDPLAFAIAPNVVLATIETPQPGSRVPRWALVALDPETGKVLGRIRLPSLPRAGGLAVSRAGRIIVAFEDGSIGAYGS